MAWNEPTRRRASEKDGVLVAVAPGLIEIVVSPGRWILGAGETGEGEGTTERLVFDPQLARMTDAHRLQERYRAYRDSLYVFLDSGDIEPTNDAAERDLRNSVIHRGVTGGYRSHGAPRSLPYSRRS